MDNSLLEAIKFDEGGLIYTIAQDRQACRVLTVAWMNAEVLRKIIGAGFAHYYSRSRQKRWMKGEEPGYTQKAYESRLDYDDDVIMTLTGQNGSVTCHTGHENCFYKIRRDGTWQTVNAVLEDGEIIYGYMHPQRSFKNERSEFRQNE